jgi:hypothetical protein
MAPCKLLAALEEAGLDDELNLIQYELDMDADANDDENEEHEEAEQLGSGDSEDDIGKANTSSTVQNTPTLSHPATRKWKCSTKAMNKMMMVHVCILNFKIVFISIVFATPSKPSKTITYILSIISHLEGKKTVSKHIPVG